MNIAGAYHAATIPNEHVVLGLRLKQYSAGHEVLLEAFQSPFVTDDDPSFEDLILAVLICSQDHYSSRKDLTSIWIGLIVRFWSWRCRNFNPVEQVILFQNYIKEGRAYPDEVTIKLIDDRELQSPSVHRTKIFLMQEMGLTEDQFLSRPLALSNADFVCIQEMYGKIGYQSPAEAEIFRQAKNAV